MLLACAVAAAPLTHPVAVDSTALQGGESNPFLIQHATDGLCLLGDSSFKRCGIDTLWFRSGLPGEYRIHQRPVEVDSSEQAGMCLGRKSPDSLNTSLKRVLCTSAASHSCSNWHMRCWCAVLAQVIDYRLLSAAYAGTASWELDGDAENGYHLSALNGKSCLVRQRDNAVMMDCNTAAKEGG
eukprot:3877-Heterococcus_DN1.PRE.1